MNVNAKRIDLGRAFRLGARPCLWLAFAVLMVQSAVRDPYDPTLTGTAAYGHNQEGALLMGLGWSLSELVILTGILRPWSYHRSWGRGLGAVALLLPWTALSILSMMHAGQIFALHALWLLVVLVAIITVTTVSIVRRDRALDRPRPT